MRDRPGYPNKNLVKWVGFSDWENTVIAVEVVGIEPTGTQIGSLGPAPSHPHATTESDDDSEGTRTSGVRQPTGQMAGSSLRGCNPLATAPVARARP